MPQLIYGLLLFLYAAQGDISMLGLHIHDKAKAIESISLTKEGEDLSGPTPMVKYVTDNGNHLAVTLQKGKIVYLENDWLHAASGKKPLLSNFTFGETSLREIRAALGTNGFVHKKAMASKTKTTLVMFNCFEVEAAKDVIFVTVTAVSLDADLDETNVADNLLLEAVVLADRHYLDQIWGAEKSYDTNYHKISLPG